MENRIKELRESAELSQEKLARKAGTTRATIMKLEKGSMALTADWMQRIADALGCDWVELLRKIPQDEKELVGKYRRFNENTKARFLGMADALEMQSGDKKTAITKPDLSAKNRVE